MTTAQLLKCSLCGSEFNLVNHHECYEPKVLLTVCRSCHQMLHHHTDAPKHPTAWKYNQGIETIRVRQETKELLDKIGNKGETYDDIVLRLATKAVWSQKK